MSQSPPFSPTVALLTVGRVWEAVFTEGLKPLGLTTRKYGLLGHIRGTPGISFSELARRSLITVQSAHTAVAAFVEAGVVDDGTAHAGAASTLRITAEGDSLLARAAEVVAGLDAEFAAQHPELTEALRVHMLRVMSAPTDLHPPTFS
ncbi:MarR family winged helix-turn-helix transcriptional regulator [Rhodococcus wratislaviensis]|uniref:MarR family winged helix-turn-helix transcriptional regulator n=1 Tax=Rhodococcus wratislaviensis TaxID=44752 RepID=UPI000F5886B5|nr:MarR family winged helix-turn-helix transcriptional regulator [Rhodococcus wratislaviensis]